MTVTAPAPAPPVTDPDVHPVTLSRDWAEVFPSWPGVQARYAGIWGAGEFARVAVEFRETPTEGSP